MTSKVYVETLQQIHRIIQEDGLVAGDKIPSERELSERLKVGRSSVREALRALEFLGIIETRRGEGTYMKEFGEHQLIDLLGTFILQEEKAKTDLVETKVLLEQLCLQLACKRRSQTKLDELKKMIRQKTINYERFLKWVTEAGENYLLERIWRVLNDFFTSNYDAISLPITFYENMGHAFETQDISAILDLFTEHVVMPLSKQP
ncbi:FadR/GntR family transcriptional regulator [Thermaerobacillus caldiproteolyticus]|uniref:GntR family transcriptional repressor for pyruvate dehydrogenase complex n=1 Tax=Thermaerobacillus caldiproteolyticus TaxID=247480 RepID=A0A7V9Z4F9_9BACL|nr:GntR family transcriptional regulator [Anoxybacillus caldiproteolyticus]MBA2873793.1 GntR family transcriptional repressor for pyruvate dehydrogenase complex [Anoxybacillus caldiproteolyticus]QPA30351.1 FadR family transcriptional regulator [Anoxybacillus caldiproteolyticus]